jgi:hypothetical protein
VAFVDHVKLLRRQRGLQTLADRRDAFGGHGRVWRNGRTSTLA